MTLRWSLPPLPPHTVLGYMDPSLASVQGVPRAENFGEEPAMAGTEDSSRLEGGRDETLM